MNLSSEMQRRQDQQAAGIDPSSPDDTAFGTAYVYCHSHLRPHTTGWCTVHNGDKTPMQATTHEEAFDEARRLGLYVFGDPRPCVHCGKPVNDLMRGLWKDADGGLTCEPDNPRGRHHQGVRINQ